MKKTTFFSELKDSLMIDDEIVDETTEINLTSLTTLSVIAFIDENFDKQVNAAELKNINTVNDLILLIGSENIN